MTLEDLVEYAYQARASGRVWDHVPVIRDALLETEYAYRVERRISSVNRWVTDDDQHGQSFVYVIFLAPARLMTGDEELLNIYTWAPDRYKTPDDMLSTIEKGHGETLVPVYVLGQPRRSGKRREL